MHMPSGEDWPWYKFRAIDLLDVSWMLVGWIDCQKHTCLGLAAFLELLVQNHLANLLGHRFDVIDDQVIQITVSVPTTDLEDTADRELVLFVQLENINVLVHTLRHLPSDSQVIVASGGWANDNIAWALRT